MSGDQSEVPTKSKVSRRRRSGGRATRREARLHAPIIHRPTLVREIPVYELLDAEGVALVHETAMTILEEIGIDFIDDESLFHCRVLCRVRLSCGPSTLYEGRSSCAIDRQPPHGLQLDGIHGGVRFRSEAGSLRVWRSPLSGGRPFTVEIRLPSSR